MDKSLKNKLKCISDEICSAGSLRLPNMYRTVDVEEKTENSRTLKGYYDGVNGYYNRHMVKIVVEIKEI